MKSRRGSTWKVRRPSTIVAVDTETTGLGHHSNPTRPDAIVQVGYAWRRNDGELVRWHATCNPGEFYLRDGRALEALSINGLSPDEVIAAPPARIVAGQFRKRLGDIAKEADAPVEVRSYNRAFDEPFLTARPWQMPASLWGPCLMQAAQDHLGHWKWPKLAEAMELLGIDPPSGRAHTAGADALAALLVYEAIAGER